MHLQMSIFYIEWLKDYNNEIKIIRFENLNHEFSAFTNRFWLK